uniref:Putative channel rhodopsin n=1 Tax=Haematococcus lacustris TaxID=44745 RepID=A0A4D6FZM8_HAELA|nr:putative channel rhodopsin [Haematococcus lacustris]
MESLVMRSLLAGSTQPTNLLPGDKVSAGYDHYWINTGDEILVCTEEANAAWLESHGTKGEKTGVLVCQWFAFCACIIILMIYAYHTWKATSGWEEVYVCCVELIKVLMEIYHEFDHPCTLYLSTGNWILWLRYGEWLLTCPVILIHLSNITGLKNDYNKRTMWLLVSDIGCVVMGVTAALCYDYKKWIFYCLGLCYGSNTYFHAAKVYIEGYHTVPKGHCRNVVRLMAWCFYMAWTMFPILFLVGPEGLGKLSGYGSTILHTVADVLSKQLWTLLGHHLRVKIHEHIIIHGNLTKTMKVTVAGEDKEVEEMVDSTEEGAKDNGTSALAGRESFIIMRDRMKQKGIEVRASLGGKKGDDVELESGRVILAVTDISMVDVFRQAFTALPAAIELVPALGVDNTVALVQQAMAMGGLDCVLLHPDFLKDAGTPQGLLPRLRSAGIKVLAYGWTPSGPYREMIEKSGVDGWLEGPSWGQGVNIDQLAVLLARVQHVKRMANMMGMMNPMMMSMMANAGMAGTHHMATMMNALNPMQAQQGSMASSPGITQPATPSASAARGAMSNAASEAAMQSFGGGTISVNSSAMSNGGGGMANGSMGLKAGSMGSEPGAAGLGMNGMAMNGMGGGMGMSGMGGMGMSGMGGSMGRNAMDGSMGMNAMGGGMGMNAMGGGMINGMGGGMINGMGGSMGNMGGAMMNGAGVNPLYSTNHTQPTTPASASPAPASPGPGAVAPLGEAEMLQQLMNEINRLKRELGE